MVRYLLSSKPLTSSKYLTFLLQANSQSTVTDMQGSLESGLTLRPIYETTKVLNASRNQRKFKQDLRYQGLPLTLQTASIPTEQIKIQQNDFGKYVSIPVDPWLRKHFNTIEEFVIANLSIPNELSDGWKAVKDTDTPYKPVWDGSHVYIPLSNWCSFVQQDSKSESRIMNISDIRDGVVNVHISVLGVYYACHKDNKLASLSMFVQSLIYIPNMPNTDVILDETFIKQDAIDAKAVKNVKRKRKKESQ